MTYQQKIDQFLSRVRGRLNRFRFVDIMIRAIFFAAAALAVVCLYYILRGYAVPKIWYPLAAGVALGGGIVAWALQRWTLNGTAHFADVFFNLKDSLSSALHFDREDREGDFVTLQGQSTAAKIEGADPQTIRYQKPLRLIAGAAALAILCTLTAFKKASPGIVEKQRIEAETNERSAEINEYLDELIEELEENATEEEKKLLDPDQLKEWVDQLNETKDRKEAMRQYAQLERKLQEAARRLDQRRNEQILTKAGQELQKDAENRALGKKMEDKKFREAAADLEKLKPTEIGNKKLSEQRKKLARLKSASQRMAAAAKAANRKSSSSSNKNGNGNQKSNNKQSASNSSSSKSGSQSENGSNGSNSESGGQIDEDIAALEKSVGDLEKALENAELQERQNGECESECLSECNECRNKALSDLDKLCKSMCKTACKSDCKSKLLSMCKSLGQCQGYLGQKDSMSLSQCLSQKAGGKKAGTGSVESRRNETDLLTDNGNTTQLKGIQGQGPSRSSIEAADEGSGVSSRRSANRKLEFSRQVESFVQREDVPDDVKQGVKTYFENIHQGEPE